MVRTIRQFWDDMKAELGLEEALTSHELICKMWRKRALTSEKKLATAVKALEQSRERLGDFQEPWNDREKEVDLILSEALAEIGEKQDD